MPHPGRAPSVGEVRDEHAVAQRRDAVGNRDGHVEGGLVLRVVVGREPSRRPLRLAHDEGAVGGRDPALDRLVGVGDDFGHARVAHDHGEVAALPQRRARGDDQLLARAPEGRRAPVHQQEADVEAAQVEVEARQGLRGARRDDRRAVELARGPVVVERQAVVGDVVAAVAGKPEERIAEPRRADAAAGRTRRPGRGQHQHRDGQSDARVCHRRDLMSPARGVCARIPPRACSRARAPPGVPMPRRS